MAALGPRATEVVKFWRDAGPDGWFGQDDEFDADFRNRFLDLHFTAARRELDNWIDHAESALALMILLDQFPRKCFRGTAHMYATDPVALYFARKALAAGHDKAVEKEICFFFYLPFSHSENLADHQTAVERATPLGEEMLMHALEHRGIIERFGRFPHRNPMLGRDTTPEEQAFLDSGGFSG